MSREILEGRADKGDASSTLNVKKIIWAQIFCFSSHRKPLNICVDRKQILHDHCYICNWKDRDSSSFEENDWIFWFTLFQNRGVVEPMLSMGLYNEFLTLEARFSPVVNNNTLVIHFVSSNSLFESFFMVLIMYWWHSAFGFIESLEETAYKEGVYAFSSALTMMDPSTLDVWITVLFNYVCFTNMMENMLQTSLSWVE